MTSGQRHWVDLTTRPVETWPVTPNAASCGHLKSGQLRRLGAETIVRSGLLAASPCGAVFASSWVRLQESRVVHWPLWSCGEIQRG